MDITISTGNPSSKPEMNDVKPEGKVPTDVPSNDWRENAISCIGKAMKILESDAQTSVLSAVEHLQSAIDELETEKESTDEDIEGMKNSKKDYMEQIQKED
jgi:hypothetical protein